MMVTLSVCTYVYSSHFLHDSDTVYIWFTLVHDGDTVYIWFTLVHDGDTVCSRCCSLLMWGYTKSPINEGLLSNDWSDLLGNFGATVVPSLLFGALISATDPGESGLL